MPAIACMNCSSRAGSLYSSANIGWPLCFTSFCGLPDLSASVRSPQNPYRRAFDISRIPPM